MISEERSGRLQMRGMGNAPEAEIAKGMPGEADILSYILSTLGYKPITMTNRRGFWHKGAEVLPERSYEERVYYLLEKI